MKPEIKTNDTTIAVLTIEVINTLHALRDKVALSEDVSVRQSWAGLIEFDTNKVIEDLGEFLNSERGRNNVI